MTITSRIAGELKRKKAEKQDGLLQGLAGVFVDTREMKDAGNVKVIAKLIDTAISNPGTLKNNAMSNIRAAAHKAIGRIEEIAPEAKSAVEDIKKRADAACDAVEKLTDDEAVLARVQHLLKKPGLPDLSRILNGKSAPAVDTDIEAPKKPASAKNGPGGGM